MKNHDKGSAQSPASKNFGGEKLTVYGEEVGKPRYSDDAARKQSNESKHGSVYKGFGKNGK